MGCATCIGTLFIRSKDSLIKELLTLMYLKREGSLHQELFAFSGRSLDVVEEIG